MQMLCMFLVTRKCKEPMNYGLVPTRGPQRYLEGRTKLSSIFYFAPNVDIFSGIPPNKP